VKHSYQLDPTKFHFDLPQRETLQCPGGNGRILDNIRNYFGDDTFPLQPRASLCLCWNLGKYQLNGLAYCKTLPTIVEFYQEALYLDLNLHRLKWKRINPPHLTLTPTKDKRSGWYRLMDQLRKVIIISLKMNHGCKFYWIDLSSSTIKTLLHTSRTLLFIKGLKLNMHVMGFMGQINSRHWSQNPLQCWVILHSWLIIVDRTLVHDRMAYTFQKLKTKLTYI
jgi:hypothetical protein